MSASSPGAMAFTPLVFDSYPWSHSLLMAAGWGLLLAALARWRGVESRAVWLIAALVVSHWILDFVTHAPDMPLWPGNRRVTGLACGTRFRDVCGRGASLGGLPNAVCARAPAAQLARRRRAWSFVLISTVMWATGPWSTPPSSERALGWFALIGWIIVPWAVWADRGHVVRGAG